MKNRGTTALIALFFAGLLGLWAADRLHVPSDAERDRHRGRVLVGMINVKPDDLRKVEIDGGTGPALTFERRAGGRWQMTAPLDVAADPSLVEGLAFRLKELARKPGADAIAGGLAKYDLAPPARTIRLWGAKTDEPLATLDLGKVSLDRRYVRADNGTAIEVVPAQGLEVVDLPPVRWRDHEVFRVPTFEVDAVRVATPDRDLQFRRGPDAWRLVAPIRALAAEQKVEELVATLGSLRVTNDDQYVANEVNGTYWIRYGLDNPALTITVEAGRGPDRRPPQVLRVGKPVEGQPDQLYTRIGEENDLIAVPARVLNDLTKLDPNAFRNEKVADIAPNRATRFRVDVGGRPFEVARTGNDWFLTAPSVGRADSKAVQEFFQALEALRTSLYLAPAAATQVAAGIDPPAEVIQVWQMLDRRAGGRSTDEQLAFTLKLGNRDAGKKVQYAQVEGDTSILALPDGATANLFKESWALRDRLVLTTASDQIEQIKFDGLGKRVTIHSPPLKLNPLKDPKAAAGWWMSEPVPAPADAEAVGKLLKLLAAIRVDGYAAEKPPSLAAFGLDAPALKVTWSIPAAAPSPVSLPPVSAPGTWAPRFDEQTLMVGGVVPERRSARYAMLGGSPVIFILGGEALATLDAEWHDHQVLKFDPAQVETIHLAWPGTGWSFDLARSATSGWGVVGPMDVPDFDPGATDGVLKAAANLDTTRYLQYAGEVPAGVGLTPPRLSLRFAGAKLPRPIKLDLGGAVEGGQSYASVPEARPGAVFLVANAPFLAWLKLQPAPRGELPDDVFLREAAGDPTPASAERPGQRAGQAR